MKYGVMARALKVLLACGMDDSMSMVLGTGTSWGRSEVSMASMPWGKVLTLMMDGLYAVCSKG